MHSASGGRRRGGWCFAIALLLSGCAVGPAYVRPAAPGEAAPRFTTAVPIDDHWWQAFGSHALDSLIVQALTASPTVASADATLRQAASLFAVQSGATRYPVVDGSLTSQRQQFNPAALGQDSPPREFSLFNATVSVRYRLDLAGANQRALEALAARTDYRRYQLHSAQLSLAAAIAGTAVSQAKLAGQLSVMESIARLDDEQLTIMRDRVRLGAASADELHAFERQRETTLATIPLQRKLLLQNRHLLATLAGRAPGDSTLPSFTMADLSLPTVLPAVIPSELVRGRPDILAAEALMQAANADYGAAVAKRYPQINLSANLGSQALTAGALFGGGSAIWSLVAQLTQPLLNRGLSAEKQAALAGFDATAATYQTVILNALRETADVLAALDADVQSLSALTLADAASQSALASERRRYALGAASYQQVLILEQQAEQLRATLMAAQAQRLLDTVTLFQAIGGSGTPLPPSARF
ncbi:efflux transporter outer membrane subunit [Gemmatimonas sp.]|uniref:efflux transporter outer membrane subunit n=1 Tax=Gemmatimonas sp. TaxID=1962908 RepID=UPI0037BE31E5